MISLRVNCLFPHPRGYLNICVYINAEWLYVLFPNGFLAFDSVYRSGWVRTGHQRFFKGTISVYFCVLHQEQIWLRIKFNLAMFYKKLPPTVNTTKLDIASCRAIGFGLWSSFFFSHSLGNDFEEKLNNWNWLFHFGLSFLLNFFFSFSCRLGWKGNVVTRILHYRMEPKMSHIVSPFNNNVTI